LNTPSLRLRESNATLHSKFKINQDIPVNGVSQVLIFSVWGTLDFAKPFFDIESICCDRSAPTVASLASGSQQVDSLDCKRNPPQSAARSRKILILIQNFRHDRWGGFEVDSPVKKPVARKLVH
jgi:hypothetical protein